MSMPFNLDLAFKFATKNGWHFAMQLSPIMQVLNIDVPQQLDFDVLLLQAELQANKAASQHDAQLQLQSLRKLDSSGLLLISGVSWHGGERPNDAAMSASRQDAGSRIRLCSVFIESELDILMH